MGASKRLSTGPLNFRARGKWEGPTQLSSPREPSPAGAPIRKLTVTLTGGTSIMPGRLWGALRNATASARAAWGPSLRSVRAGFGVPPRDRQRQGFGGPERGALNEIPLADAAAAVKRRLIAANERLGSWALREAPPAFRLRGGRYASYPGAPQRETPRRGPLEQQKKANALSGLLLLFAACVVIGTPVYLNCLHCTPKAAAAARPTTG
ncbi:hypothetical protein Emag_006186 [Eimeria magna]